MLVCTSLCHIFLRLFNVFSPFVLCPRLSRSRIHGGNRERQQCFPCAEDSGCFCSPSLVSRLNFTSLSTTFLHQLTLQHVIMLLIEAQSKTALSSFIRWSTYNTAIPRLIRRQIQLSSTKSTFRCTQLQAQKQTT